LKKLKKVEEVEEVEGGLLPLPSQKGATIK
jgi:hypothetical protein